LVGKIRKGGIMLWEIWVGKIRVGGIRAGDMVFWEIRDGEIRVRGVRGDSVGVYKGWGDKG
jgi:hypothetical protein